MAEFGQQSGQQFYAVVSIKGSNINTSNIIYLIIREWVFNVLPMIEMQFIDDGIFTEIGPLEDMEEINVLLAKNEDAEETLEVTFLLDDYTVAILGDNKKCMITLTGHLKASEIFHDRSRRFTTQNSVDVCKQIALESGIPFVNPRSVVSSDNMKWYQPNICNFYFIKEVLNRAYVPNDVPFFYANTQNEFVYTSLQSEINKQDLLVARYSIENAELNVLENDKEIWFANYDIVNYSGFYNKTIGYGISYSYYDLKDYQEDSVSIIPKISELSFRNSKMVGTVVERRHGGDYIAANLYGVKYFEAILRNRMLKENFFGMSVLLDINSLTTVKLFDKINLQLPSLMTNEINEVWSGEYLIGGIQHEISKGGIYRKKISIHRNGMNKSNEIISYQAEQL